MRVRELVGSASTRSAPTAPHISSASSTCCPTSPQEFEGVRSDAEIRTCADAVLPRYDDVPIRSHVMTIAHRQTRDCLRAERCDALAVA